jgi:hypothetical protein
MIQGPSNLLKRPLMDALWQRRTHRISAGTSVPAGSMSYVSTEQCEPLSELEEAILIGVTGCTGLTMPDRPFQDPATGEPVMAKPNLTMAGRSAGSPDNAQGTHFFMLNDHGTYFLQRQAPAEGVLPFDPDSAIERARRSKIAISDHRVDVPTDRRNFPAYLDSNRLLSNLAGTTIFFPVVDLSRQYINGLMYLLTEPDGSRPAIVDDRNFYALAGVRSWVKRGFLNSDIKIPLGILGMLRTQIEADLLLQNLMLVADSMGLGAWIHGSISPPVLLGAPEFTATYGTMLGFDFATPPWRIIDVLRWQVPLPKYAYLRSHPIGLRHNGDYLIKAMCPPYYANMTDAVDEIVNAKFGKEGLYRDEALFSRIYKANYGQRYLAEAADYSEDVINCAKDVCTYVYETHGRFPAHCDAIFSPGVWIQVHHIDKEYYHRFFMSGLNEVHAQHDAQWHSHNAGHSSQLNASKGK